MFESNFIYLFNDRLSNAHLHYVDVESVSDKCLGAIASNKAKCRPSSDVDGTTINRVTIHFVDLAKFWPLCCRKGSIED